MSKIKNGGLDQYDTEPFEPQQFGTAGVKGVKRYARLGKGATESNLCKLPGEMLLTSPTGF